MKSNSKKKNRIRISKKKFEEKIIAEKKFNDLAIGLENDPYKNNPEYFEEQGIDSLAPKLSEKIFNEEK